VVSSNLPVMDDGGRIKICPLAILEMKLMKKDYKVVV
jgi:hypothetical protein